MIWIIGFLTAILVLDCLLLILLILIQLPKKEAGLGQAFGGGTTDALFGAGSGNALTKMTKYATAVFLVLTLSLSILNANYKDRPSKLQESIQKLGKGASPASPASSAAGAVSTNLLAPVPVENPATNTGSTNATAKAPAPVTPAGSNNTAAPAPK